MTPPTTPVSSPGTAHSGSSLPSLLSPSGLPSVPRACSPLAPVVLSPADNQPPAPCSEGWLQGHILYRDLVVHLLQRDSQDFTVSPGLSSSRHVSVSEMTHSPFTAFLAHSQPPSPPLTTNESSVRDPTPLTLPGQQRALEGDVEDE